jgi:hypothetical protein
VRQSFGYPISKKLQSLFIMDVVLPSLPNFEQFARHFGRHGERVPKMILPLTGGGRG